MSGNSWISTLVSQQGSGAALTNSTTATSVLLGQAKYVLAANWFESAGKMIHVRAGGKISTAASAPGTLTFDIRFGGIIVFTGGASPTLAVSASNLTWILDLELVVQAVGSGTTATVLGTGTLMSAALSATTPIQMLPASSPAPGTGFDSTTSFSIDLFATWSVANASNTITCTNYRSWSEN